MAVHLSRRLAAAAAFVTPGNRLADVGTDHGYVPIALCEQGRVPRAIALDVREGPLSAARRNIAAAGLFGQVETRLSDGLAALAPGEADTVLLAGMGGALMQRILKEGAPQLAGVRELVLQPQSEIPALRRFLRLSAYQITHETVVKEDGKFYVIWRAVPQTGGRNRLPETSGGGNGICVGPAVADCGQSVCAESKAPAAAGGGNGACAELAAGFASQGISGGSGAADNASQGVSGGLATADSASQGISGGPGAADNASQGISGGSGAADNASQGFSGGPAAAQTGGQNVLPEDAFGPVLLAERPALWCEWIGVKLLETDAILAGLRPECEKHPENVKALRRLEELETRRRLLAAALEGTI